MCLHFGEQGGCFYGGVMQDEVYPAVRAADALVLLCPNYNDALSANLTAFINRLTALFRQTRFYDKAVFAIVVSFLAIRAFRWMISHAEGKNLRRYPVFAFVICLLLSYCAEEFFGVADIIGVKVELPSLDGQLAVFALLLLATAILSKVIGCGLGARLCGFRGMECAQVGAGMACRGEVALIVANRGLSMGVMSQAMMTPIIITVVGCAVLTPVLLKLVFRGQPESVPHENSLMDGYRAMERMDQMSAQLLNREGQTAGPAAEKGD